MMTRRLAVKMTLLFGGFLLVVIVGFFARTYNKEHRDLQERFGMALERVVATAALQIDGDKHGSIMAVDDAGGAAFQQTRATLERIRQVNYLPVSGIYTFNIISASQLRWAVMLQDPVFSGNTYAVVPENVPLIQYVIDTGNATHTGLYMDEHGSWVSAYAPIRDSSGKVTGILEADYDLSTFEAAFDEEQRQLLMLCLLAAVVAIIASVYFGRRLEHDLRAIRDGARAIEHEDYSHRIDVVRDDELGLVAAQFNRMAEVLAERFHMLKFLPRHTLDAVKRRALHGDGLETERVEASIFFSDIRGYTKMSEGLPDEKVVQMLNQYLRRQAEIIEEHGGTIDKFIGDAVLAVFRGEEHERRAVRAALQIQTAIARMNEQKAFERAVHVGIGVASGGLVLGEVGSEGRRERTLIGSTVNLASRLCSHAGADEVVVSDLTRAPLGVEVHVRGSERVALKGFSGEQQCHVVVDAVVAAVQPLPAAATSS